MHANPVRLARFIFKAVVVLGMATVRSGAETPEFSGYLRTGQQSLFVLTDLESKTSSGWISSGQSFRSYRITGFDDANDMLILQHGTQTLRVPLKGSRVVEARSNPARPELTLNISLDGVLSLNGEAFPGETLDALFAKMAAQQEALRIVIQQPYYPSGADLTPIMKTADSILERMRAAGFRRGEVVTNRPPKTPAK